MERLDRTIRVSAVIPAYNAGDTIGRAIESVLRQSRAVDEVIVVDDGSTDRTAEVAGKYSSQVNYIYQENAGASVARNTGIKAAKFEWIAFLDGDDEWLQDRLKLQIELLERNPQLRWCSGNSYHYFGAADRKIVDLDEARAKKMLKGKAYFEEFFDIFTRHGYGNTDTMLIRKEVFDEVGLFRVNEKIAEDLDMWFRIAYRWKQIGYVTQPIAIYHRYTAGSATMTHTNWSIRRDLIKRHLELSKEAGRQEPFERCARRMIKKWIRGLLFKNEPGEVRAFLDEFSRFLCPVYKLFIRTLLIRPGWTAGVLRMVSRVFRLFRFSSPLKRYSSDGK